MSEPHTLMSWQTSLHPERARSNDWYWIFGFIIVAGAVGAFLLGNPFLGVILLLGGILLVIMLGKDQPIHTVQITTKGIAIDDTLYRYDSLISFAVPPTTDGHPRLVIHISRPYVPFLSIPLEGVSSIPNVKLHLRPLLREEEKMQEPFLEQVMHALKL